MQRACSVTVRCLISFLEHSLLRVQKFNYDAAAKGVIDAVSFATSKSRRSPLALKSDQQGVKKKTVVIIQRRLCDYRALLFEQLNILLIDDGVDLRLLYGEPTVQEQSKQDSVEIFWGEKLATRYLLGERICWQPFFKKVRRC